MTLRTVFVVVALVAGACATTDAAPTTTAASVTTSTSTAVSGPDTETTATRWGFVPFPGAQDAESVGDAFRFVAAEGDLVAFHFDDGIPWDGLLTDADLPPALVEEMAALREFSLRNPQLGVYVATAITNQTRDGIPGEWRAGDPPQGIAGRLFGDPDVREGIRRWVSYVVDELQPTWLNLAVEINMYDVSNPKDYANLVSLYRELYAEVKAKNPDTVVFASFQMELADPLAARELVDSMDMVGISAYPAIAGAGFPPEDYFASVAELGLPLAIAETGYPARTLPTLAGEQTFTAADQADYVAWLGRRAESPGLVFVTWFFPTDITGWIDPLPAEDQAVPRLFEFLGLRSADGQERPALDVWRALASK